MGETRIAHMPHLLINSLPRKISDGQKLTEKTKKKKKKNKNKQKLNKENIGKPIVGMTEHTGNTRATHAKNVYVLQMKILTCMVCSMCFHNLVHAYTIDDSTEVAHLIICTPTCRLRS